MEKNTAALTDELIERLALHHIAPGVRQLAAIGGEGFYRQTEQYARIKAFSLALLVACQGPAEDVEPYGTDDVRLMQANRSSPPLDLEAPCRDLIKYCDSHPPMGESLWFVQQIRAALASHPAPQAAAEGVGDHPYGTPGKCADGTDCGVDGYCRACPAATERPAIPAQGQSELPPVPRTYQQTDKERARIEAYGQACRAAQEQAASCPDEAVAMIGDGYQLLWARIDWSKGVKVGDLLYARAAPPAAPQPRELTDADIADMARRPHGAGGWLDLADMIAFARKIEHHLSTAPAQKA